MKLKKIIKKGLIKKGSFVCDIIINNEQHFETKRDLYSYIHVTVYIGVA